MEAQVPQPITATSTRFGPLTLAQLGWCAVAALVPFLLLVRLRVGVAPGTLLSLPTVVLGLGAAFARPEGRPAAHWVADCLRFQRQPRELGHPLPTRECEPGWRSLGASGAHAPADPPGCR